ncbi:MAG: hypothetical protein K2I67_01905 [Malacoplasma sp.]|nr:hypothetical protein [Malacoplasma sp.]
MKSSKVFKSIVALLVCVLVIVMTLSIISVNKVYNAYADTEQTVRKEDPELKNESKQISPYGLTTSLSLSINSGNGKVWATVRNDLTVFSSTVIVIVQLYSSEEYAESYTEMERVSMNSIGDLDIGQTISTEAETGGVEKFWLARMRYKIDNGSWSSRQTAACRISASGEFLGYI